MFSVLGNKIGKSTAVEGVTIWLSGDKTTPYDFYQHWINLPDADLSKMLLAFSFKSVENIHEVSSTCASFEDIFDFD